MLISAYVREKDRVLDFACGKGGDLTKYRKANVGTYTGVDIALESVRRDAVERYNGGSYPFSIAGTVSPPISPKCSRREPSTSSAPVRRALQARVHGDPRPIHSPPPSVPLSSLSSSYTLTLNTPPPDDTPTLRTAQLEHRGARRAVRSAMSRLLRPGLLRRHHRRRQRPGSKTARGGRPRLRQSHRRGSFRRRAQNQALPSRARSVRFGRVHARRGDGCEEWMVPKKPSWSSRRSTAWSSWSGPTFTISRTASSRGRSGETRTLT